MFASSSRRRILSAIFSTFFLQTNSTPKKRTLHFILHTLWSFDVIFFFFLRSVNCQKSHFVTKQRLHFYLCSDFFFFFFVLTRRNLFCTCYYQSVCIKSLKALCKGYGRCEKRWIKIECSKARYFWNERVFTPPPLSFSVFSKFDCIWFFPPSFCRFFTHCWVFLAIMLLLFFRLVDVIVIQRYGGEGGRVSVWSVEDWTKTIFVLHFEKCTNSWVRKLSSKICWWCKKLSRRRNSKWFFASASLQMTPKKKVL